jgi:hypothetical protein
MQIIRVEICHVKLSSKVKKTTAMQASSMNGFEALASVVMNVSIFWDIAPCSPYMNRRFGGCIISIFRVGNELREKPACSRWLGRI